MKILAALVLYGLGILALAWIANRIERWWIERWAGPCCSSCKGTREIEAAEQIDDGPVRRLKAPCPWC